MARPQWSEDRRQGARISCERCEQVLHEVDLVDVSSSDCIAHTLDCGLVLGGSPRLRPLPDATVLCQVLLDPGELPDPARG
jgi:hypothetical protein